MRARFYSPVIGRFIQEDTYFGDGLNLYDYCHSNPVGYVDPSGYEACPQKEAAIDKLAEVGFDDPEAEYNRLRGDCNSANDVIKKINNDYSEELFGKKFNSASDITKDMRKEKPKWSRNVDKWYKKGGTIAIDGKTWTYIDKNGIAVQYKGGLPDFLGAGVVQQGYIIDVGTFTNRSSDFSKANAKLGYKLPTGFTWHHHIDGKTLYGISTDIHKNFTHRGGISLLKELGLLK